MAQKIVHVAVGVIRRNDQILIAKRADDAHQGGLWEFPGGKVEEGETIQQALVRELQEELNITPLKFEPLIEIRHDYGDKQVFLDTWVVSDFSGKEEGREGQPLEWVDVHRLHEFQFPEANKKIVAAIKLPQEVLVTGQWHDDKEFSLRLTKALQKGLKGVIFRAHDLPLRDYQKTFQEAHAICKEFGALLIANTAPNNFPLLECSGLHLTSRILHDLKERPTDGNILVGASCHCENDIHKANELNLDYVLLGSVFPTPSHPGIEPLGIEKFKSLTRLSSPLVYAIGGITSSHLQQIKSAGGHGVSGISAYWAK